MEPVPGLKRPRRALLSVTDKSGLADIATVMQSFDYDFVASGGTAAYLASHGIPHRAVSELTGYPEIFGGRVKTLHPAIHGGILGAREADFAAVAATGIAPIDVVCVNLYRFAEAAGSGGLAADVVEQIDVGGPALLRAAAKNFARVTVLSSPADYEEFLWELRRHDGDTSHEFRRRMAAAAFARTAAYDADIAGWFAGAAPPEPAGIPLRYGENPHQAARLCVPGTGDLAGALGACGLRLWGGRELSYNNLVDLVAALKLAADFPEGACAIIKHTNPCGLAVGATPAAALERALACDPDAAFGGVYAFSMPLDEAAAELLAARFAEVVAAPACPAGALATLQRRRNLRILTWEPAPFLAATRGAVRAFGQLRLEQDEDEGFPELDTATPTAGDPPSPSVRAALALAWRAAKHVKSNAVVLADAAGLRGVGAGQMSRVDAVRLALHKARERGFDPRGAVAASDGFFPFPDSIELLADAGVTAVIAPGGSLRDAEVAAAAAARGLTLIQAARRHFRH
ncbi:MAG: bifunctional phosphoribosylaminoimidazolecarboxamide formyltransferase/IMP cyclohydrolase [Candidatus Krumholzibacteriia bacterium]